MSIISSLDIFQAKLESEILGAWGLAWGNLVKQA